MSPPEVGGKPEFFAWWDKVYAESQVSEVVGYMHPTAHWVSTSYHEVNAHCRKDGPRPVPLFPKPSIQATTEERNDK